LSLSSVLCSWVGTPAAGAWRAAVTAQPATLCRHRHQATRPYDRLRERVIRQPSTRNAEPARPSRRVDVRTRTAQAVLTVVGLLLLAGCGSGQTSDILAQARAGDQKGFVSGDGRIDQVAIVQRTQPVPLSGITLDGKKWALSDERGQVVVLNVWGSWCGPCVREAPDLQKVWKSMSGRPVRFMGIDVRENAATAKAFLVAKAITYPSLANDGGGALIALGGKAPAVPTTLVIDRRGRLAARVLGPVAVSTLTGLIEDALKEAS